MITPDKLYARKRATLIMRAYGIFLNPQAKAEMALSIEIAIYQAMERVRVSLRRKIQPRACNSKRKAS